MPFPDASFDVVWMQAASMNVAEGTTLRRGPPPLGRHLLLGPVAGTAARSNVRNIDEGRIVVVQGVFDYWGCPAHLGDTVVAEVQGPVSRGRALTTGGVTNGRHAGVDTG